MICSPGVIYQGKMLLRARLSRWIGIPVLAA